MILSGDDLTAIPPARLEMLRKLEPPTGVAARFDDDLEVGIVDLKDRRVMCLLNWTDAPKKLAVTFPQPAQVRDMWSGEDLGRLSGAVSVRVEGRSGRLLECRGV
jgi:alpha-galactosidase